MCEGVCEGGMCTYTSVFVRNLCEGGGCVWCCVCGVCVCVCTYCIVFATM